MDQESRRKFLQTSLLSVGIVGLSGCNYFDESQGEIDESQGKIEKDNQPLSVEFTFSPEDVQPYTKIQFKPSSSEEIKKYTWQFEHIEAKVHNPSPTVRFPFSGTTTVTLSVENYDNQTGKISKQIDIEPADFGSIYQNWIYTPTLEKDIQYLPLDSMKDLLMQKDKASYAEAIKRAEEDVPSTSVTESHKIIAGAIKQLISDIDGSPEYFSTIDIVTNAGKYNYPVGIHFIGEYKIYNIKFSTAYGKPLTQRGPETANKRIYYNDYNEETENLSYAQNRVKAAINSSSRPIYGGNIYPIFGSEYFSIPENDEGEVSEAAGRRIKYWLKTYSSYIGLNNLNPIELFPYYLPSHEIIPWDEQSHKKIHDSYVDSNDNNLWKRVIEGSYNTRGKAVKVSQDRVKIKQLPDNWYQNYPSQAPNPGDIVPKWKCKIPGLITDIVVNDNTAIISTSKGILTAVNISDGTRLWNFTKDKNDNKSLPLSYSTVQSGSVFTTDTTGIYSINLNRGSEEWKTDVELEPYSRIFTNEENVYTSNKSKIYAFDITDGDESWAFEVDSGYIRLLEFSDNRIYATHVTKSDTDLYILNGSTGEVLTKIKGRIVRGSIVENEMAYIHGNDTVSKVDIKTGTIQWEYELSDNNDFLTYVQSSSDVLFVSSYETDRMAVIDKNTGNELWTKPINGYYSTIHSDSILVNQWKSDSPPILLDLETGEKEWEINVGINGRAVSSGENIYIYGPNQSIQSIDIQEREEVWTYYRLTGSKQGGMKITEDNILIPNQWGLVSL